MADVSGGNDGRDGFTGGEAAPFQVEGQRGDFTREWSLDDGWHRDRLPFAEFVCQFCKVLHFLKIILIIRRTEKLIAFFA